MITKLMITQRALMPKESEETEVKSKQELIEEWESAIEAAEFYGKGKEERLISYMKDFVSDLNQLDEPEVLSDKWIDDNQILVRNKIPFHMEVRYAVPIDRLQNLLVPKQEEMKRAQIPEWIIEWYQGANNEFSTLEDVFSNLSHDTNYNIMDSDKFKIRIMKYGGYSKMYEALSHIYFGAYEIEGEEQKYIVSDNSSIPLLIKTDKGKVMSYDSQIAYNNSRGTIELTEQEIKDYDERYWPFAVKVEELEE